MRPMTDSNTYTIESADRIFPVLSEIGQRCAKGLEGGPVQITLGRPNEKRSTDQNRLLWPLLTDLSNQIEWFGEKLTPDQWKDLVTAAFRQQKTVPGLNGGVVAFGLRTSKMKKAEFSELIEFIFAEGTERGVKFTDPALRVYDEYKEAK